MVYDAAVAPARGLSPHVAQQAMAALAAIAGRRASIALDAGRAARAYAAASADAAALAVDTLATFYNERVGFYNEAVATRASAAIANLVFNDARVAAVVRARGGIALVEAAAHGFRRH